MNNETSFIELALLPSNQRGKIEIAGKFNVHYENDGLVIIEAEVLKHIALVVTRTASYQAVTPFQDVIVFEDDVIPTDKGCTGSFNFNVFDKVLFDGPGDYYILCSIGTVTSNIIHTVLDEKN